MRDNCRCDLGHGNEPMPSKKHFATLCTVGAHGRRPPFLESKVLKTDDRSHNAEVVGSRPTLATNYTRVLPEHVDDRCNEPRCLVLASPVLNS